MKPLFQRMSARLKHPLAAILVLCCCVCVPVLPVFANEMATGARVVGDTTRTRFVVDLTAPLSYSVYVLPEPYRVIIDVPNLSFNLPEAAGQKVRGLVSEYRFGIVQAGKSRIVLDTKGPVLIEKSYLVNPQAGQPARIVVDMVKTSEDEFMSSYTAAEEQKKKAGSAALTRQQLPEQPESTQAAPEETAPQKTATAPADASEKAVTAKPSAPVKPASGKKVIVIDAGHGGIDPGAMSATGIKEKDVVLNFAKALRKALSASGRYEVVLTREDDKFLRLKARVEVARQNNADLFIAIHADTVRGQDARGATIYTLSEKASDAEADALAAKENRADIIGGLDLEVESKDVSNILIDLAQRESKNHAVLFSKKVVAQLQPLTLMTGKPMRSAGFVVLKAPDVPSVLLELGYLSSKQDVKLLTSPQWQASIAKGFTAAIDAYFATELAVRTQ